MTPQDGQLVVTVTDDGVGGAALDGGSGLQGLEDRVGALDGTLAVESPPGEGTRVLAAIPLAEPRRAGRLGTARGRVLSDAEAAALQARRRRGLRVRAAVLGVAALIVVAVWALTGAPNAWPVWPLLGLGLVAALDAWAVLGNPPARRSDLAGEPNARALQRRRGAARHGRQARDRQRVPDRDLARRRRRLLLAGLGDAGLRPSLLRAARRAPWPQRWSERGRARPSGRDRFAGSSGPSPRLPRGMTVSSPRLAGADADRLLDRVDEHAAVADVARCGPPPRSPRPRPRPCSGGTTDSTLIFGSSEMLAREPRYCSV